MTDDLGTDDAQLFEELQDLVALEVRDIMKTAAEEGFSPRDVVSALELALRLEIEALAGDTSGPANPASSTGSPAIG